jgi:hypothetical protein
MKCGSRLSTVFPVGKIRVSGFLMLDVLEVLVAGVDVVGDVVGVVVVGVDVVGVVVPP